jgi:hypothetical protein
MPQTLPNLMQDVIDLLHRRRNLMQLERDGVTRWDGQPITKTIRSLATAIRRDARAGIKQADNVNDSDLSAWFSRKIAELESNS